MAHNNEQVYIGIMLKATIKLACFNLRTQFTTNTYVESIKEQICLITRPGPQDHTCYIQ